MSEIKPATDEQIAGVRVQGAVCWSPWGSTAAALRALLARIHQEQKENERLREALREIAKMRDDAQAIRREYPQANIPIVELSNVVDRCAKIAQEALGDDR